MTAGRLKSILRDVPDELPIKLWIMQDDVIGIKAYAREAHLMNPYTDHASLELVSYYSDLVKKVPLRQLGPGSGIVER